MSTITVCLPERPACVASIYNIQKRGMMMRLKQPKQKQYVDNFLNKGATERKHFICGDEQQ